MTSFDLTAASTNAELRAAAERYAASTYEQPDAVLARLQDAQWELRDIADPKPGLPAPTFTVTPWSDDVDLIEVLDELEAAYPGVDRRVLAGMLRDLRWHLREATTAAYSTVRDVLENGVSQLVTHATTDQELDRLVVAAEAGSGGPIPGLRQELVRLRDSKADLRLSRVGLRSRAAEAGRVFVSEPSFAPRIVNFDGEGR